MSQLPDRPSSRACFVMLLMATGIIFWGASRAQGVPHPAPFAVASSERACAASEDMFRALKLTWTRGSVRVDYQFLAADEPRWANMNADLVRRLRIKVGATFCMTRDTGSAEAATSDFD